LILVEVLEALPGRPISGERLVRPDGTLSLGFYGDVEVAGLTVKEAKEKIVLYMKKYLTDDCLGLVEIDPETGKTKVDAEGKEIRIDPKDSDRVFLDVTAYNSRQYYIEGEVYAPGRLPFTGGERVLDIIHFAGGLRSAADRNRIRLIRSFPKGSPVQVLPIDYEEITMGTDASSNYQILPNDRLVVPRIGGDIDSISGARASKPLSDPNEASASPPQYGNKDAPSSYYPTGGTDPRNTETGKVERRLNEMEKKLDTILKKLEVTKPDPQLVIPVDKRTRKDARRRPSEPVEIEPREQP